MRSYILIVFIFFAILSCDQTPEINPEVYNCELSFPEDDTHSKAADFQRILNEQVPFTPGVQAFIATPDGQRWSGAAGYADLESKITLETCHRLLIASISKVITATMIFQLQDEGILSVDDPLSKWLAPELISDLANSDQVTLRHLLNHTSGMPDYLDTEQTIDAFNTPYFELTQKEKLAYAYGQDAVNEPGEAFYYSNTNFVLLGLIVEAARDMTLWEATEQFLAEPLGLQRFNMGKYDDPIPADVAKPYLAFKNSKYFDVTQYAVSDAATGDGGVLSNMQDLGVFLNALFSNQLISEAALNQMTSDLTSIPDDDSDFDWDNEAYGLGITRYNTPHGVAFGHTGFSGAYTSLMFYFPENGAILTVVSNGVDISEIDQDVDQKELLRDELLSLMFQ